MPLTRAFVASLVLTACAPASAPLLPYATTVSYADCNEDGRLTWSELGQTTYHVRGESKDRAFSFANFTQADSNSDQVLTLSELRAFFTDKNCDGYNFNRTCP